MNVSPVATHTLKLMRRAVIASFSRSRGLLPSAVNDALFHLPTSVTCDTLKLARARGWLAADLGARTIQLPSRVALDASDDRLRDLHSAVCSQERGPSLFSAEIPRGRVLGLGCSAIAAPGIVLTDVCPHRGVVAQHHRALSSYVIARPPRRLPGTSALIGAIGHDNFYHWMFDVLPRIGLIRDGALRSIDQWIVARTTLAVATELLARAGIDRSCIVEIGRGGHIECERLIVTSAPGEICEPTPRSVAFLREALSPTTAINGNPAPIARRIYVARRGRRRVANEASLQGLFTRFGIEVVSMEGRSLDEQIAAFSGAELIIAPHGAALAHIIHARVGATLLELMPPDYNNPSFFVLAGACGMRYGAISGSRATGARGHASEANFDIDSATLERALEVALQG